MAYADSSDIQERITRTLSAAEIKVCDALLEDAAVLIDTYNSSASEEAKKIVSCRMVMRALGSGSDSVPIGASQGSMSALGYSQSWTVGSGGSAGELYLSKTDKKLLGAGSHIGSRSPVEFLVPEEDS